MGRLHPLTQLDPQTVTVAPSILAANFSRLGDEIQAVERAGAEVIHVDVMDGHFVPNISMGPPVVKSIRGVTSLPMDVHLMLTHPARYADAFLEAGADHITVHVESEGDLPALLEHIASTGASTGITLRPGTPVSEVVPYMDQIDLILVMTVEPGFGGQSFMVDQLPKIQELRCLIDRGSRPIHLQVDGGIAARTAPQVIAAGGRMLVAGSSVFRAPEGIVAAIAGLRG